MTPEEKTTTVIQKITVKKWTIKDKYPCPKCNKKVEYPEYTCENCNIKIKPVIKF